jgi:hypothetical protein
LKELIRILVAVAILGRIADGAAASGSAITQEEADSFVRSFYHDLEGDDFDKFMGHFDQTVQYYSFGAKDRSYIADDLGKYCATYASRSFTVGAITLKPGSNADRATVKFQIRFLIRSPAKDITRGGRINVEWDLAKRDGALKIIRFDGSAAKEPAASPTP